MESGFQNDPVTPTLEVFVLTLYVFPFLPRKSTFLTPGAGGVKFGRFGVLLKIFLHNIPQYLQQDFSS